MIVLMKPENAQMKAQIEFCYHVNVYVCTPINIVVYTELTLTFIRQRCVQFPFPILQAYCIVGTSY